MRVRCSTAESTVLVAPNVLGAFGYDIAASRDPCDGGWSFRSRLVYRKLVALMPEPVAKERGSYKARQK
jgi:hypothetical protein